MRRTLIPLVSAAAIGSMLPLLVGPTADAEGPAAFAGYDARAWAAPVKIEIYEPTIPLPATPQAEASLGYTTVEANSGLASGRGSWVWPGDPVGEGAKTILEQAGFPAQLAERGYPVQVNSSHPGKPSQASDESVPGSIMRTGSSAERTYAQVGFSPDAKPTEAEPSSEPEDDEPAGGGLGLPALPPLPVLGGGSSDGSSSEALTALTDFGSAINGEDPTDSEEEAEGAPEGAPGLPPELAALVDLSGYTSQSIANTGADRVSTVATSALGDVSLADGLVVLEGISARMRATSDGAESTVDGVARIGGISIAGTPFELGSDGLVAADDTEPVPGLPEDPVKALAQLGITVVEPREDLTTKALRASGSASAIRLEWDLTVLRAQLKDLPLNDLVGAIPAEAAELKSLVGAAVNLSPRIVLTFGNVSARAETIKAPAMPALSGSEPTGEKPAATASGGEGAASAGGAGTTGAGTPGTSATTGSAAAPAGDTASSASGELTDTALTAGLPALNTIPGALTMGGVLAAIAAGTWLRRIGLLALGTASTCSAGLDAGLPDLRRA
ncbi:choice-of-anchor P family protein [Nocardioides piscis]|uniref:PASTA domain-containing protein n=1 Tax=Nocardioides piscis TaxID=2714938 RepID=A0A6G7YF99_9ACTN|nr:choice-of-anchor P family protein [Nocardioides piscis]QIK75318.1 hypothetical protein G7071_07615 [Nocardioides piscis]